MAGCSMTLGISSETICLDRFPLDGRSVLRNRARRGAGPATRRTVQLGRRGQGLRHPSGHDGIAASPLTAASLGGPDGVADRFDGPGTAGRAPRGSRCQPTCDGIGGPVEEFKIGFVFDPLEILEQAMLGGLGGATAGWLPPRVAIRKFLERLAYAASKAGLKAGIGTIGGVLDGQPFGQACSRRTLQTSNGRPIVCHGLEGRRLFDTLFKPSPLGLLRSKVSRLI